MGLFFISYLTMNHNNLSHDERQTLLGPHAHTHNEIKPLLREERVGEGFKLV